MSSPLQKLQSLLNERPFRPFFLRLRHGEHVVVSNPRMVELAIEGRTAGVLKVVEGPVRLSIQIHEIELMAFLGADEELASDLILYSKYPLPLPTVRSGWRTFQHWICFGLILAGFIAISFSLLASIDDGHGPIGEVIRIRRIAAKVVLFSGIVIVFAVRTLHRLDHQVFRSYDS